MIGGGSPISSVGKPTSGISTGRKSVVNVAEMPVSAFIVTVQPPIEHYRLITSRTGAKTEV